MNGLIILATVCIIAVVVYRYANSSGGEKGKLAETGLAIMLSREISRGLYGYVFRNLYIPKDDGETVELELVLVCTKGVFVIDSKNFKGYVIGDDTRDTCPR